MPNHYNDPYSDRDGLPRGQSHGWANAPDELKQAALQSVLQHARRAGLSQDDQANVLAIVSLESGFNPDAAAPPSLDPNKPTSAAGLGQLQDGTWKRYGNRSTDQFDIPSNADATVKYYSKCKEIAQKRELHGIPGTYAVYHDGEGYAHVGSVGWNLGEKMAPSIEQWNAWLSDPSSAPPLPQGEQRHWHPAVPPPKPPMPETAPVSSATTEPASQAALTAVVFGRAVETCDRAMGDDFLARNYDPEAQTRYAARQAEMDGYVTQATRDRGLLEGISNPSLRQDVERQVTERGGVNTVSPQEHPAQLVVE